MTDLTEVIGEVQPALMVLEGLVLDFMMTQTTPPGTADVGRRGCCIKYPNIPRMNIFPPVVRIPPHMTVRYLATTYCTPSTTAPLLGVPQGTAINIQNITINKAREQKIKSRGEPPNTQTNNQNPNTIPSRREPSGSGGAYPCASVRVGHEVSRELRITLVILEHQHSLCPRSRRHETSDVLHGFWNFCSQQERSFKGRTDRRGAGGTRTTRSGYTQL